MVIDKFKISDSEVSRLKQSIETAMKMSKNVIMIADMESDHIQYYSRKLMCPTTGLSYEEPAPHSFSFNSPHGACTRCGGLGYVDEIDIEKIIPNQKLSIKAGAIKPIGAHKDTMIFCKLEAILAKYDFKLTTPFCEISDECRYAIMNGSQDMFSFVTIPPNVDANYFIGFDGILALIEKQIEFQDDPKQKENYFISKAVCPECQGQRLKKESLYFKITEKNMLK